MPYVFQDKDAGRVQVTVTILTQPPSVCLASCSLEDGSVKINLQVGETKLVVCLKPENIEKGCIVNIPNIKVPIKFEKYAVERPSDDLNNYVRNFMQWYFVIIQMKDAIHEGDFARTNIILKQMIPFFYSHSVLSKYFTECIDFLLKTEHTLSPKEALKVKAGAFVNVKGHKGGNKAADMHKENEVKLLKDLIKGLGANKTEQSITMITKASPTLSAVCENYDEMVKLKKIQTTHKVRCQDDDISTIVTKLNDLDVWAVKSRTLQTKVEYSPFNFDKNIFKQKIQSTVDRLRRDIPDRDAPSSDEESSDAEDED